MNITNILTKPNITKDCDFCSQMSQFAGLYSIAKKHKMHIAFRERDLYFKYGYHLDKCFVRKPVVFDDIRDLKTVDSNLRGYSGPYYNYAIYEDISYYKIFHDDESDIKLLYTFFPSITETCKNYIKSNLAEGEVPVSIHFRRGDYLVFSSLNLSLNYYKTAINKLYEELPGVKFKFFIYSNTSRDLDWIASNFELENVIYVKGFDRYHDLCSMSLCEHNIIANSSFSFWAAYLNKNQNKVVICPYKYGIEENLAWEYFPETWIGITEL